MDELKVTKERRKSFSLTVSPKNRKTVSKTQPPKQAATTVGWKRGVKKEEEVVSLIQPKELFKERDKSAKRLAKPGRAVPSRYTQITSAAQKRSFPEKDKEEVGQFDKRQASQESPAEAKAKRRWKIARDVVLYKSLQAEEEKKNASKSSLETPLSVARISEVLPLVNESPPRDSGPAKRAAELVGRRNYFGGRVRKRSRQCLVRLLSFLGDV